jgi:adenylate kinase
VTTHLTRTTRARTRRWTALTGTPGTGKSRAARLLAPRWEVAEVGELALATGTGKLRTGHVEVDLAALRGRVPTPPRTAPAFLVGHLAHLLPVDGAIVLRCDPLKLRTRLVRARRGSPEDRYQNMIAEVLDLVAREARERRLSVWEIDTSDRSPREVAAEVERIARDRPTPWAAGIDWLADPRVTAHLLDRPR